jgi:predicted dehydrogenase
MDSTKAQPGLPVRIALIGSGAISRLHFPAFRDRPDVIRLAAVCEKNPAAAEAFVRQFSYPVPTFTDLAGLLREREFDAALVALPHHLHFPVASELVKAGVPVLVEKPLTASLEEARALRDLSTKYCVPVVVGQMLRFAREVIWLKNWIREDPANFGHLRTFDIQSWQNILAYVTTAGGLSHWLLDGKLAGGGVVVSLAVHQLDLIRFISGDDFTEVTAWGRFDPPFHNGAESCALALLKMNRGACGVLHATYTGPRVPYCEALTMFGENGTITQHVDSIGQYRGVLRYATTANQQTQNWNDQFDGFKAVSLSTNADGSENPFVNQLVHFALGLIGEEEFRNTVSENFNTLACIDAIYTSIKTGQPCPVARN